MAREPNSFKSVFSLPTFHGFSDLFSSSFCGLSVGFFCLLLIFFTVYSWCLRGLVVGLLYKPLTNDRRSSLPVSFHAEGIGAIKFHVDVALEIEIDVSWSSWLA